MPGAQTAYVGLGANLGDPAAAIERAIGMLNRDGLRVVKRAPLYRTQPLGPADQPDYVNTAVEIETIQAPATLLASCKAIERALGRTPAVRWGPRIIDLDILLYGETPYRCDAVTIPHPELHKRRFALVPLADLAPERVVPGLGRTVGDLAATVDDPLAVTRMA